MPRATDIMPITGFTRAYQKVVKDLKKHGRPKVLTIDGKPAVVVMDAAAYDRLVDIADTAYLEAAIDESLADTRPPMTLDEFKLFAAELRATRGKRKGKRSDRAA